MGSRQISHRTAPNLLCDRMLEQTLTRGLASNRIWMLLQSAAILGVMARGFKWLWSPS